MPRKKSSRITNKAVQSTEGEPFELPTVEFKPEADESPWGLDGLKLKQRLFAEAYVGPAGGNATEAARIAGYSDSNVNNLAQQGAENLRKPQIRGYIGRLLAQQGMTPDFLKSRLAELASSSLNNFATLDEHGDVVFDLKHGAALGALGQVKEVKEEILKEGGKVLMLVKRTIKVHDPIQAIRTLLEMQGALQPGQTSVTVTVNRASDDDLIRIATRGSQGTVEAPAGAGEPDRVR